MHACMHDACMHATDIINTSYKIALLVVARPILLPTLARIILVDKLIGIWPSDKWKRLTLTREEVRWYVSGSYCGAEAFFAQRKRG